MRNRVPFGRGFHGVFGVVGEVKREAQNLSEMKSLVEARELWLNRFRDKDLLGDREISVLEALGRITSGPVFAGISSPHFHAAAMDGVAVHAEATYGAQERTPKKLKLNRDAFWINTGRPIPAGTNSVIMVEKLGNSRTNSLRSIRRLTPGRMYARSARTWWPRNCCFPGITESVRTIWARCLPRASSGFAFGSVRG